jgi:hypothetical protein
MGLGFEKFCRLGERDGAVIDLCSGRVGLTDIARGDGVRLLSFSVGCGNNDNPTGGPLGIEGEVARR